MGDLTLQVQYIRHVHMGLVDMAQHALEIQILTSLRQTFEFKHLHLRNASKLPSDSVEPKQAEDPAGEQTPAHA